ncbi:hypothetical protein IG631_08377 [Alternaria alternata]|nr:hypothetical protein IG631_08377 [Alternaria alternata]
MFSQHQPIAVQALCKAEVVPAAALHEEAASDVGRHGYISAAPERRPGAGEVALGSDVRFVVVVAVSRAPNKLLSRVPITAGGIRHPWMLAWAMGDA